MDQPSLLKQTLKDFVELAEKTEPDVLAQKISSPAKNKSLVEKMENQNKMTAGDASSTFSEEYFNLKPNYDLINTQFEKYLVSNDPCQMIKTKIPKNVRFLKPSEDQWAFQYAKLYSQTNGLLFDQFYSTEDYARFYFVIENGQIYTISFDIRSRKWDTLKFAYKIIIPDEDENASIVLNRLPHSMVFTDDLYAFVGNGYGAVTLFRTFDRDRAGRWEPLLTFALNGDDGGKVYNHKTFAYNKAKEEFFQTPCIVADARRAHFNQFDVLIHSIFEKTEKKDKKQSKFANRLTWVTIGIDNHRKCETTRIRTYHVDGRLDLATLDKETTSLVIIGGGKPKLIKDTDSQKTTSPEDPTASTSTEPSDTLLACPTESMDQDTDITNAKYAYIWTQTHEDISAIFKVGEDITKKDVDINVKLNEIDIKIREVSLLTGELGGMVNPDESTWTFGNHRLELTLFKKSTIAWSDLVNGDKRGFYQTDPKTVANVMEQLEKFTSDKEVSGFDGSGPGFNKEELEECDQSDYEITYVSWLDNKMQKIIRYSDISSHQLLFTTRLSPGNPVSFCLRHDNDAILWSLEEENVPMEHKFTFNAFGYVQASKEARRFTTCSPFGSYAAIADLRNHSYIYWREVQLDPECTLTNRKTGKITKSVNKLQVLSLARMDGDYKEDENLNEFIGVYAHDNVFFLLTHNTIYALVVKPIEPVPKIEEEKTECEKDENESSTQGKKESTHEEMEKSEVKVNHEKNEDVPEEKILEPEGKKTKKDDESVEEKNLNLGVEV